MKNRFIEYLIEKNRRAEEKALKESWSRIHGEDHTKYDPWKDNPLDKSEEEN
jgi:hypothetical protein